MTTQENTFNTIKRLNEKAGVTVGNYSYCLDGEIISGYEYEKTEVLEQNEFIPVVRIETTDGWVEATNYRSLLNKIF